MACSDCGKGKGKFEYIIELLGNDLGVDGDVIRYRGLRCATCDFNRSEMRKYIDFPDGAVVPVCTKSDEEVTVKVKTGKCEINRW